MRKDRSPILAVAWAASAIFIAGHSIHFGNGTLRHPVSCASTESYSGSIKVQAVWETLGRSRRKRWKDEVKADPGPGQARRRRVGQPIGRSNIGKRKTRRLQMQTAGLYHVGVDQPQKRLT